MSAFPSFVFVWCCLFAIAATSDFCEDRSANFEKGRMQCESYYNRYSSTRYRCTVTCHPGFIAKPAKQINCQSNGNRVWKVDSRGNRAHVYYGNWSPDINQAGCEAPTSCLDISNEDKPLHGDVVCTTNNQKKTCIRNCAYPYEVSEPAFRKEQCGPDTDFFWSHVLRNNITKMPACVAPRTCRALRDSDMPDHGYMVCRTEEWAETVICELQCERGYIPKATSKPFEFCGPTTAFVWSHIHAARNSSATIGGCELWYAYFPKPPIAAEITVSIGKSCENISSLEKHQGAEVLLEILNSTTERITVHNTHVGVRMLSWRTHCNSFVIHKSVDRALTSYKPEEPDMNQSTATTPIPAEPKTQVEHINTTVSHLIFAFYYKVNCAMGRCEEACAILPLPSADSRCKELCRTKARPTAHQVRHLTTTYVDRVIEAVDVSTVQDIMHGAQFKLLNVTSKASEEYTPTENDVNQIKATHSNYYSRSNEC